MGDLLLGIDVGTASSKGVLLRPDGSLVAEARADHGMEIPRPGWAEQDADAVWWADVCALARALIAGVPPGDRIAGVAMSAIGPTLLPLDEHGRPLRRAILYGVDTRATEEIAHLETRHGDEALRALSGHGLSSQAVGPKIAWLARLEPDVAAAARWHVTASTYLGYRMTGELAIDAHTASHWNPLFDPRTTSWTDRFADGIAQLDRLPPIRWPADRLGTVSPDAARETGIPAGTPVAVGTVDVQAEALSVGVAEPGDLMIMYGSTTFFLAVVDAPVAAGPLWLTAAHVPGRWCVAAGLATGGSALAWFRDQFARDLVAAERASGENAFTALGREAEGADAGELLFLPYLSGERTPLNDPDARGVVAGLSLHTSRGAVYRSLLHGIADAARANVEEMRRLGVPIERVTAVGGGTADPLLVGLVSDACGIDQRLPASTIGASRGDAFLAGVAAGILTVADLPDWVEIRSTVAPDPTRGADDDRFTAAGRLYLETRDSVHRLARGRSA